jgi:hypothetical protein
MNRLARASIILLAACGGTPTVFLANHATGDRPVFEIEGGKARHIEIFACQDSTHTVWQADAPAGEALPAVVVDSTKVLAEGCYEVRIVPGNRRRFSVMPDRVAVQEL